MGTLKKNYHMLNCNQHIKVWGKKTHHPEKT